MRKFTKLLQLMIIFTITWSAVFAQNSFDSSLGSEDFSSEKEISKKASNVIYDQSKYPVPKQGGDDIATALVIASLPYSDAGTTSGYTNDYDEACPYTGSTSPDVVYSYAPASDMTIDISLCSGSAYDTKLYVYENDEFTPIACNDDACPGYVSELIDVALIAGNTYYIVVDGYGGANGTYTIDVLPGTLPDPVPDNDLCANAIALGGEVFDMPFSTSSATASGANPSCGGSSDPLDIWYTYTPTYTGTALFDLCGSGFDTRLAIWDGCAGSVLICNDDACGLQSGFYMAVTSGTTYYIQIGGYNTANGTGDLTVANSETEWTGATDNAWNTSSNWTYDVPTANTAVTVPTGLTNYPTLSAAGACGDITLKADGINGYATLLDGGFLTVYGTANVESHLTGGIWHFVGSPVTGATAYGVFHNPASGSDVYLQSFDETTNTYSDVIDATLNPMQGYAAWVDGADQTFTYSGTYNTGAFGATDNMSRTINGDGGGNNLLANPYASGLDWDLVKGSNLNMMDAYYVEDNGGWATYISGAGIGTSGVIAPGQGFFAFVSDGGAPSTGTVLMDNSDRVHTTTAFLKSTVANLVRLEATGNGRADQTIVRFLEDATPMFDEQFDAFKLDALDLDIPQIYSVTDKDLAINALPETSMVQLGFVAHVDGEYSISATEINDIPSVWLEDTFTDEFTNMTSDTYTFTYTTGDDANRFILHFAPLGVDDDMANSMSIYSNEKDVFVIIPELTDGTISVINMIGQEVAKETINGERNKITLAETGYYVVVVTSNDNIVTQKVFIK